MNSKIFNSKYIFINGFFYVFGLTSNPITQILDYRKSIADMDSIESDWIKIGTDIRKVYEQETSNIA
ncbi:MAG: hypothetical protein FWC34_10440 [Bacteroidetes bacterium]|nr:hypothetical protein [Bacteroidota bacterium]MCL2302576.1 hypothetical protein [Lentimicrobiaceae bacterium]